MAKKIGEGGGGVIPRISIAMTPSEAIILIIARNSDISLPQILRIIKNLKICKDVDTIEVLKDINRLVHYKQVIKYWNEEKGQFVYSLNIKNTN